MKLVITATRVKSQEFFQRRIPFKEDGGYYR